MNILRITAYVLVLIGALNWGLVGMFGFDLIAAIFGDMTLVTRVIYSLAAIGALVHMFSYRNITADCACIS